MCNLGRRIDEELSCTFVRLSFDLWPRRLHLNVPAVQNSYVSIFNVLLPYLLGSQENNTKKQNQKTFLVTPKRLAYISVGCLGLNSDGLHQCNSAFTSASLRAEFGSLSQTFKIKGLDAAGAAHDFALWI